MILLASEAIKIFVGLILWTCFHARALPLVTGAAKGSVEWPHHSPQAEVEMTID